MGDEPLTATARWTDFLGWGSGGRPDDDDPAETYHEASKNLPSVRPPTSPISGALDTDPQAQATIARAAKRQPSLPVVDLPAPRYPETTFAATLQGRRSRRDFGSDPLHLQDVATLLHASYGVTAEGTADGPSQLRSVPSGGALYPLEIYPVLRNVAGVAPGLYHYDPTRVVLEVVHEGDPTADLEHLLIPLPGAPELASTCGMVVFVVGIFWRTRFKYGLRGYRWALLEAGHVGQSFVLAAEALACAAVPYGGFWDRRVDAYLGLDGVNESVVYSLVAGNVGSTPSPSSDTPGPG